MGHTPRPRRRHHTTTHHVGEPVATQQPVRDVGYKPTDEQILINRDLMRVVTDLINRVTALQSAMDAMQRKVK